MADESRAKPVDLGIYSRPETPRILGPLELAVVGLSGLWLMLVALLVLFSDGPAPLPWITTLVAAALPVAVLWVGAIVARSSREMRDEAKRLQAAVDALRQAYVAQAQAHGTGGITPAVESKLDEIYRAQKKTQSDIATFTSIRQELTALRGGGEEAQEAIEPAEQGLLALGTPADGLASPLSVADYIRALNFPENTEDREGFNALRRALQDRRVSPLVQASQDVLTLLSEEGIYMDDLVPDRARPEIWRHFAKGERGRVVAALGGIRDRSSLALAASRMRNDPIFRDAVHHFLRKFDRSFAEFETIATDADIAELADTRTARAFMVLGRVTGTFD